MPFMIFSPTSRTCFMRASSSLSALLAASSALTISGARENEPASSTRLRASSCSKILTTPHATASRLCCSSIVARSAGRGITSAIVIAIAAASVIRKNQIFERNTAPSLLRGRRACACRDLGFHLGLALGFDADRFVLARDPTVAVPDLDLVRAGRRVGLELAALVGIRDDLRIDDDDLELEVRRVFV